MASSFNFMSDDSDSDTLLKTEGSNGSDTDDELPLIDVSTPRKAPPPIINSVPPHSPAHVFPTLLHTSTPPRPPPPSPHHTQHDGSTPVKSSNPDNPSVLQTPEPKPIQSSSSHSSLLQPGPSFAPNVLSPLKLGDTSRHQKTIDEGRKLASKAGKLSKNLKQRTDRDKKIDGFKKMGGIRGLRMEYEEQKEQARSSASEGEKESETQTPGPDTSPNTFGKFSTGTPPEAPALPMLPPGKIIFTNSPLLITELYPPGLEVDEKVEQNMFSGLERNLMQDSASPEALKEAISGGWIRLCYQNRPCPQAVWQWLFQIMCRSSDDMLSNGAFRSLTALLQIALRRNDRATVHTPSLADIVDVLVCMGADQNRLFSSGLCTGEMEVEVDESDDVFQPKIPTRNLSHFLKYFTTYTRMLPGCYTLEELENLVILLLNVALDPQLCGQLIETNIVQCIGVALAAIPEESWMKTAKRILSRALALSDHHHNQLHIAYLISGTSETEHQRFLQKLFCRESIAQITGLKPEVQSSRVKTEATNGDLPTTENRTATEFSTQLDDSDCLFAQEVIVHYYRTPSEQYDYYCMYSVLRMLSMFMLPAEMKWPSQEKQKVFEHLLGSLSSEKIRENLRHPERGPVKDLVIRMKLEVNRQKVTGQMKQTDLFAFQ